ncbi:MAG: ABC transporter ATP-binding protein [Anaerolineae bacterium]|nr:ABC transporter ATP-binding protein [Anaerolineae bacterium]
MSLAIKTVGLSKYFYPKTGLRQVLLRRRSHSAKDRITAVDGVTLEVKRGELFGLLGPNGAGKTTLVKILCTLILPNSGTATVNGFDLSEEEKVKASIGLVGGEERSFYWRLSGRKNLEFFATLHGFSPLRTTERIERLAKLLDMEEFIDRRFDRYSSGMKQRLGIARGLLNEPQILFLDEPTKSLDPTAAARLRETIHSLTHREAYTVMLVTHQLHEAEELCDRIAIMHKGRIRVVDDIAALRRMVRPEKRYRFEVFGLLPQTLSELRSLEGVLALEAESLDSDGLALDVRLLESKDKRNLAGVINAIVSHGGRITDVTSEELSLDEIFKRYTREEQEDD